MAITAGNWYAIEFKPFTDAAWASLDPFPLLPGAVASAIRNGTSMLVYCEDDSGPLILHYNGGSVEIDASVIDAEDEKTKEVTNLASGAVWTSVRTAGGAWEWFDSSTGVVRHVNDPTSLSAFLVLV